MDEFNSVDVRSQSDVRRLHVSELNEDGTPLLSLPQQQAWNAERRDYVDNAMVTERNDRIPYHNPLFHINGPYVQGPTVPPLLIRRPSNQSLLELLPEAAQAYQHPVRPERIVVNNQVNLGPDVAGGGANAPGPVLQAAVRPFMPPNPVAIAHREEALRLEFGNYRQDPISRINRDPEQEGQPLNMETNHAIQNNHMRVARRQRHDEQIRAAEEELAQYPPAAQPDEDDPPVNFGGVEMDLDGDALVANQHHGQPIPAAVYGIDPDDSDQEMDTDI